MAVPSWLRPQAPGPTPHTVRVPDPAFDRLAALVRDGAVLALTGAGMSTDSGIPDYRGRDGVRRVMPMQYAEFAGSSGARQRYWARSFVGWQRFSQARPNPGHRALARLQHAGLVSGVVTQNVDGLHQAAGSTDVVDLHGSLAAVVCLNCRDRTERTAMQARMEALNPGFHAEVAGVAADGSRVSSQIRPDGDVVLDDAAVTRFHLPVCLRCGADTLKPDVVFFGQSVPPERVERSIAMLEAARSLLVLGSSLAVMSGYRFVRHASAHGIPVAILTRGATRGDAQATVRLDAGLTPTLESLVAVAGSPAA